MPYCPKCDMEYVDGITICSDCGEPLLESKETAKEAATAARLKGQEEPAGLQEYIEQPGHPQPVQVYINKSQKYEDLRSSAFAFSLVGGIVLFGSALGWAGILPLPANVVPRYIGLAAVTLIGIGCMAVAAISFRSAKELCSQADEEDKMTRQLVEWFLASFDGSQIDRQILEESGELTPEELSLKRFSIIQDRILTGQNITDQSYVDLISEEIYGKLYENYTREC